MIFLFLPGCRLMAVQAIYTLAGVHAHLILMHDRILGPQVTFRAFPRSSDQGWGRFLGFDPWSCAIDEQCTQNQSEGNHYRNEDGAKRHASPNWESFPSLMRRILDTPATVRLGLGRRFAVISCARDSSMPICPARSVRLAASNLSRISGHVNALWPKPIPAKTMTDSKPKHQHLTTRSMNPPYPHFEVTLQSTSVLVGQHNT